MSLPCMDGMRIRTEISRLAHEIDIIIASKVENLDQSGFDRGEVPTPGFEPGIC